MRVLVLCTVHDPRDARVNEREIGALLDAGHEVTLVAPFTAFDVPPPAGMRAIDIPRSQGRRRVRSLQAARRVLRQEAPRHDLVIVHSPEHLAATAGLDGRRVVWDVHEDTAAAVGMKSWLPGPLRPSAAAAVRRAERRAERRVRIILAEDAYAERFTRPHPIVRNVPVVPDSVLPSARGRAVYLGTLTEQRGGDDLVEVGRLLSPDVALEILGGAHGAIADRLAAAQARGDVAWRGFVPNAEALGSIEGATVGLALLHDEPNYRHSMPTKLYEYLARGIPFVSTPLPLARELAEQSGGGILVPFGDPAAAAAAVRELDADDDRRQAMARAGRQWVIDHADWRRDGPAFVRLLEGWAG